MIEVEKTTFGTASLGGLIKALEQPGCSGVPVRFRFSSLSPDGLDSYRGFYEHLAIGYSDEARPTVMDLVETLRCANGASFCGYKGGSYLMDLETPVWVSNYGHCTGTMIVGVTVERDFEGSPVCVFLETEEAAA